MEQIKILISLGLTKEQYELLDDAISSYEDEGPAGEGWRSAELTKAVEIWQDATKNIGGE